MGEAAKKLEVIEGKGKKKTGAFADALKSTKKKATKKSAKSKMPVLDAPDEIKETVDLYLTAKADEKKAKAEKDDAGAAIIEFVRPFQDTDGYKGNFRHSYAVPGTNGNQVKFVSSNRFSINADDQEELEELLGDEFEDMIEVDHTVSLKKEVLEDEELQEELMQLVGDRFADFFETVTKLKVKDEFDKKVYGVVTEEELPILRTWARPYTPSLRA